MTEPIDIVIYAWPRRGGRYHAATGKGKKTACGKLVTGRWKVGAEAPAERRLCEVCSAMQMDLVYHD